MGFFNSTFEKDSEDYQSNVFILIEYIINRKNVLKKLLLKTKLAPQKKLLKMLQRLSREKNSETDMIKNYNFIFSLRT